MNLLPRRRRRLVTVAAAAVVAAAVTPAAANAAVFATFSPAGQTLAVFGDNLNNTVVVSRDPGGKLLVNGGAVAIAGGQATIANTALIQVFGQGGGDVLRLDERNGALPRSNLFGGSGNDFLVGGAGFDLLFGQAGNDTADGRGSVDMAFLGQDDDSALWTSVSEADLVFGEDGQDRLRMVGTAANDDFRASADGEAVSLLHNRSATLVSAVSVEDAVLQAAGGADDVQVGDLRGTAMRRVAVDLAGSGGGASPDSEADRVKLAGNETSGDHFTIAGDGAAAAADGTTVTLRAAESARDRVSVDTGAGGDDVVDASGLPSESAKLTVRSGDGADVISGGHGADGIDAGEGDDDISAGTGNDNLIGEVGNDTIDGGAGNDTIDGRNGEDTIAAGPDDDTVFGGPDRDVAHLGDGNDRFMTSGGQGSDTVEGEDGFDRLQHHGTSAAERFEILASAGRNKLARDLGAEVVDMDGVERIATATSMGDDQITVYPTDGTALREVDADLGGPEADSVKVFGTSGADQTFVTGSAAKTLVTGLPVTVRTQNASRADALTVQTLFGEDSIDASAHDGTGPALTLVGDGSGDTIRGSAGRDVLMGAGGADRIEGLGGDDVVLPGTGDDRAVWSVGDGSDLVDGAAGTDRLELTGNASGETIALAANGTRLRLDRALGAAVLDVGTLEQVALAAGRGGDTLKIGDLAGTGVTAVTADLGAGDGNTDRVEVDGTSGDDRIALTGRDGAATVGGLPAATSITAAGEEDRLEIRGLAGADSFDTSALGPIVFGLSLSS